MNPDDKDMSEPKSSVGRAKAYYKKHLEYRKHRVLEKFPDGKPSKIEMLDPMEQIWKSWTAIGRDGKDILFEKDT